MSISEAIKCTINHLKKILREREFKKNYNINYGNAFSKTCLCFVENNDYNEKIYRKCNWRIND